MVGTLETIVSQRPLAPLPKLVIRLTTTFARLAAFELVLPATRQPAAIWTPHALRGVHNPRLMYCRLRAAGQ